MNNLDLKVPSGEYSGYSILFDLSFVEAESISDAQTKSSEAKYKDHPIGNTIRLGSDKTVPKHIGFQLKYSDDGSTSAVGGVTEDNKTIVMNQPYDTKMNRIHEIFHTFGFSHPKGKGGSQGIMKYPPQKPTSSDALELSTSTFLPSVHE